METPNLLKAREAKEKKNNKQHYSLQTLKQVNNPFTPVAFTRNTPEFDTPKNHSHYHISNFCKRSVYIIVHHIVSRLPNA